MRSQRVLPWYLQQTYHQTNTHPYKIDPSIGTIGTNGKEGSRFVYWYYPINYEKQTSHEYSSFYKPTTQNKFAFTLSRNALIVTKRGRTSAKSNNKVRSKYKHVLSILRSISPVYAKQVRFYTK